MDARQSAQVTTESSSLLGEETKQAHHALGIVTGCVNKTWERIKKFLSMIVFDHNRDWLFILLALIFETIILWNAFFHKCNQYSYASVVIAIFSVLAAIRDYLRLLHSENSKKSEIIDVSVDVILETKKRCNRNSIWVFCCSCLFSCYCVVICLAIVIGMMCKEVDCSNATETPTICPTTISEDTSPSVSPSVYLEFAADSPSTKSPYAEPTLHPTHFPSTKHPSSDSPSIVAAPPATESRDSCKCDSNECWIHKDNICKCNCWKSFDTYFPILMVACLFLFVIACVAYGYYSRLKLFEKYASQLVSSFDNMDDNAFQNGINNLKLLQQTHHKY